MELTEHGRRPLAVARGIHAGARDDVTGNQTDGGKPSVVIIGGGLSGAAVAYHLARSVAPGAVAITVVEPREELGRGLAYGTTDPDHRLNVPHVKMTLTTAEPEHFERWLDRTLGDDVPAGSVTPCGKIFPPRAVFGRYVGDSLRPLIEQGRVRHVRAAAIDAYPQGQGYVVRLDNGDELAADTVVLAVSHPAPSLPAELNGLAGYPALVADPFAPGALDSIGADHDVLVIGSGLTGADLVASLSRRLTGGKVHLLSRHGWRSQPHGPAQDETSADFATDPAATALTLLRNVRRTLAADASRGMTWHAVFDRLRSQGNAIWAALPLDQRRKLLRHLRGLWDIHRFRIAPQTRQILQQMEDSGRLTAYAGRIAGWRERDQALELDIRLRHAETTTTIRLDRIILATGPAHGRVTEINPLLRKMKSRGLLHADPLRLGLNVTAQGEIVDAQGKVSPQLLVAGPLARASVGELMGVPEITFWAEQIAARVAERLPASAAQLSD